MAGCLETSVLRLSPIVLLLERVLLGLELHERLILRILLQLVVQCAGGDLNLFHAVHREPVGLYLLHVGGVGPRLAGHLGCRARDHRQNNSGGDDAARAVMHDFLATVCAA
jgi:hypothetical protein